VPKGCPLETPYIIKWVPFYDICKTKGDAIRPSMLLEQSVNPKVVQKLLGHRDIETTLGIYSHVLPEVLENVAETIDTQYKEVYCNLLQMTR